MSTLSIALTALLTLTMVVLIAPNILALNRGKVLQNIALWLAIVLALALIYQLAGPGKSAAPATARDADQGEISSPNTTTTPIGEDGYVPSRE